MKTLLFRSVYLLIYPLLLLRGLHAAPVKTDSLPAGARISIEIALPGDATTTKFHYVVPAPVISDPPPPQPPRPVDPTSVVFSDGLDIGKRGTATLVVRRFFDKLYLTEQLLSGQMLVRGPNLLSRGDVVTQFESRQGELTGGETGFGGLIEPAGFITPPGYVRKTFSDGAVYYERGLPDPDPKPDSEPDKPQPPVSGSDEARRYPVTFAYSSQPNRLNRLQVPTVAAYRDGWKMKQSEIVAGGNGGLSETPDELRARGHNWFNALWFYGQDGTGGWGLPKAGDNLFFEYTGNYWGPYHQDAFAALTTDFQSIANQCIPRLSLWNSAPENGLIDGVPTVKEGHFNIEYVWVLESDYQTWNGTQRNTRFYNYSQGRYETVQECYHRGGVNALLDALHQKWRNIIALSVLYLNANNQGMKAYYGDYHGLTPFRSLVNWTGPASPTELLHADPNNGALFGEANESANAGRVTVNNQTFDVSGNLNAMQGIRHCYNYEWYVFMNYRDFQQYRSISASSPADQKRIGDWYGKMKPDVYRPYDIVYHVLLNKTLAKKKGWPDWALYWQTETIYENNIIIPDWPGEPYHAEGSWVFWTLNDPAGRPTKIPLHPEVMANLTYLSRMHYDGKFLWGAGGASRLNPDANRGENLHPQVHPISREAEAHALGELGLFNETVFLADKRQHIGDIAIQNPVNGQYVTGHPDILLSANGNVNQPVPLVTGVDSPSSGWELYFVYYPHASRDAQTTVRWKSPVDGAELSGTATGWGGTLYARKRPANK